MSNEELVAAIQSGDREKLAELWAQVERFVWQQANRRPDAGAVDREDLYQSGYLALVAAVDSYNPEREQSFIGWLALHLMTAFNEASNYRTRTQRRDPMHGADSLDRPLGEEADSDALEATVAAPDGEAGLDEVEAHIWQEQLHAALEDALATLPLDQSDALRRRHYGGQSTAQIAEAHGTTPEEVRKRERKGLETLRRSKVTPQLRAYIEERTPYYLHVGVEAFQRTGESAVERIVAIRAGLEKV